MNTKPGKQPANMRLSPYAMKVIKALAHRYGLNNTSVVEMAVRALALKEGLEPETLDENDEPSQ